MVSRLDTLLSGFWVDVRGNHYSIENISETQVELFFAQARELRANEPDDEADDIEGDAEDVEAAASK